MSPHGHKAELTPKVPGCSSTSTAQKAEPRRDTTHKDRSVQGAGVLSAKGFRRHSLRCPHQAPGERHGRPRPSERSLPCEGALLKAQQQARGRGSPDRGRASSAQSSRRCTLLPFYFGANYYLESRFVEERVQTEWQLGLTQSTLGGC